MTPSESMDELAARTTDWRGAAFTRLRAIIREADPQIVEEWKWVRPATGGTPVWEHNGIVCFVNVLKERVRLTMFEGASLPDPKKMYNAMLEGNKARGIDFYQGDKFNEPGIKALIRAGVQHNLAKPAKKKSPKAKK